MIQKFLQTIISKIVATISIPFEFLIVATWTVCTAFLYLFFEHETARLGRTI